MKTKITLPAIILVFVCLLSSCNTTDSITDNTADHAEWIDSVTDERGVYIGQEKEVIGYYKRIGIAKIDGTYEDMLELRDTEKQGYLVANDDGTTITQYLRLTDEELAAYLESVK